MTYNSRASVRNIFFCVDGSHTIFCVGRTRDFVAWQGYAVLHNSNALINKKEWNLIYLKEWTSRLDLDRKPPFNFLPKIFFFKAAASNDINIL